MSCLGWWAPSKGEQNFFGYLDKSLKKQKFVSGSASSRNKMKSFSHFLQKNLTPIKKKAFVPTQVIYVLEPYSSLFR